MNNLSAQEQWIISHAPIGQNRTTCPWCSPTRKKKSDTCLSVLRDDETIKFQCHHGDCGAHGIIILKERTRMEIPTPKKTEHKARDSFGTLNEQQYAWLQSRKISSSTAQQYELIGEEISGSPIIGFPYFDENTLVDSVKKRWTTEKKFICWQSPSSFFGLKHLNVGDDLYIVEGEMDVLAMAEAGIKAVSVPNGASTIKVHEGRIDPSEDHKFKFLWKAKKYIEAAKRIILACDMDKVGEAYAEEIARRVGKERCWKVVFPDGIKDANEFLMKHSPSALKEIVDKAIPWPIEGLYGAEKYKDLVNELYEKGSSKGESTGYPDVDELYTISTGMLTIVTGIPSSGKSEFVDQIMMNLATRKHWKFGVCSFENEPRYHISKLISKRAGMPFFSGYHREKMSREEYEAAYSFVNDHFCFLHQEDGGLADLESILNRLKMAVLRYGIRGAVIDPYNYISKPRGEFAETEWISDMLTRVRSFAAAHGIHIWFVAHPYKLKRNENGKYPVPGGYEISGSAAWFAKADFGLTVHRDVKEDPLTAEIHIWKCRFAWLGKQGETKLFYDVASTRYVEFSKGDDDHTFDPSKHERFEL